MCSDIAVGTASAANRAVVDRDAFRAYALKQSRLHSKLSVRSPKELRNVGKTHLSYRGMLSFCAKIEISTERVAKNHQCHHG